MKTSLLGAVVLGAPLLLVACEHTSSSDLKTRGIDAEILVTAQSDALSTVQVSLFPGGDDDPFNRVELQGGDSLFAEVTGMRKLLAKNVLAYSATFNVGAADSQFRVSLERPDPADIDAPDSLGTLPTPFTIAALAKTDFPRSETVPITWSPSGSADPMSLAVSGDCIDDRTFSISGDPGSYALAPGAFAVKSNATTTSCPVRVTVRRWRTATVDPNLNAESSFTLEQVRSTSFNTTP